MAGKVKIPKKTDAQKKRESAITDAEAWMAEFMGPSGLHEVPAYLPSGSLMLDLALGQGYPCGHLTELFGRSGTGKTLFMWLAAKSIIEHGGVAVVMDTEARTARSLVSTYVGLDPTNPGVRYYYQQKDKKPFTVEAVCNDITALVERWPDNTPLLIGLDSISALRSAEQSEDMTDHRQMGLVANKWSQWFANGLIPRIRGREIYVIFNAQTRTEVNFFKKTAPADIAVGGGKALEFYASTRIEVTSHNFSSNTDFPGKDKYKKEHGKCLQLNVVKNSVSPPMRSAMVPYWYYPTFGHRGIDDAMSMMMYLKIHKKLQFSSKYEFAGGKYHWLDLRNLIRDDKEARKIATEMVIATYKEQYS